MITKMEDRVKIDLVTMSTQILAKLRELCEPDSLSCTPEMLNQLAVQFNQGALLQYQYGEIERSEKLCQGAIEMFAQLSSHSNRVVCLANMVAPYINLGRIYGQKGHVSESLSIFEEVYRFSVQRQDLWILGHRISVTDAPAIFSAATSLQRVMLSCRVIDTARVLQTVEDYPALLALIETSSALPEYQDPLFAQYFLEVRSRALLSMKRYKIALETLTEFCSHMAHGSAHQLAIYTLISQVYRESGHHDLARATLDKLEEYLGRMEKGGRNLPIFRQIAYRLALERRAAGDGPRAAVPAEKAFRWCAELNDQPGCIKSLMLLLRICTEEQTSTYRSAIQRHWYDQLKQFASTTLFRLERACAYWELGLCSEIMEFDGENLRESARECLQNSCDLYRSIPFVDSMQSCEAVRQALESRVEMRPADNAFPSEMLSNASVDSTFDALMRYVPSLSSRINTPSPLPI